MGFKRRGCCSKTKIEGKEMNIERIVKRKMELEKEVKELKEEIESLKFRNKLLEKTSKNYQETLRKIGELLPIGTIRFYSRRGKLKNLFRTKRW